MLYTIDASLVDVLKRRMQSFIKKFEIHGDGNMTYKVSEPYVYVFDKDHTVKELDGRVVADVEVEGQYKIGDYTFVAQLTYNEATGRNIVNGDPVPDKYMTSNTCEHCNTNRYRIHTTVLKYSDGSFIQVGSSCVKDFLGVSCERYASYLEFISKLRELEEETIHNATSVKSAYLVEEVLEFAAHAVAKGGYVSKDRSWELDVEPTSRVVWKDMNHYKYVTEITEDDKRVVNEVRDMVAFAEEDNGYVSNLKTLLSNKYVTDNNFGLVVSALGYYLNQLKRLRKEAEKEILADSKYVGNVGEKFLFSGSPEVLYETFSDFGSYFIYRFLIDGNEIIWKTSKVLDPELTYEVRGTIKAHREYNSHKQTELTRCRTSEISL